MRELANRLEHLGFINRDIRLAVAMTGPHGARFAALRADFAVECNHLHNQLTAELAAHEKALLASRLLDQFVSMRLFLARHHQRWTTAEIKRDPEGYVAMALFVNAGVVNFVEDALATISAAITAPPPTCAFAPAGDLRLTRTG